MSHVLYLEGGGDSKELHARCRENFSKLLRRVGLRRMPRLFACGGRNTTFDDFRTAWANARPGSFVAMVVDSEDPVRDIEKTWDHLRDRDGWAPPDGAEDDQVLFMTTCMETWILADRKNLKEHYGSALQESALPPLNDLEKRERHKVQDALAKATKRCSNAYAKGKRSFEVLGKLDPSVLASHLPSFERAKRILKKKLR